MNVWVKRVLWVGVAGATVFVLWRSFQPTPVLVDAERIARGTLRITVEDDGRTRVRDSYTISMPFPAHLLRTTLEPGDSVVAGKTVVVELVASPPLRLDPRARAEAEARLARASAARQAAEAQRVQAEADARYAASELERVRGLSEQELVAREQLERAERDQQRAAEGLRAATFAVDVARFEETLVRAGLLEADAAELQHRDAEAEGGARPRPTREPLRLTSPITGKVLRVHEESARTLPAGAPILTLGDPREIEIVAEFLSQDAVRMAPGMRVFVSRWGGGLPGGEDPVLEARVRLVEPSGFTKLSALGVEEQRVNVLIDPAFQREPWQRLGDGYRVDLEVVLVEVPDALLVPSGALFREGDDWFVFVVEDERARRKAVVLGRRGALAAEVKAGLSVGDRVVLYPGALLEEGVPVSVRDARAR